MTRLLALLALVLLSACATDDSGPAVDAGDTDDAGETGPPECWYCDDAGVLVECSDPTFECSGEPVCLRIFGPFPCRPAEHVCNGPDLPADCPE